MKDAITGSDMGQEGIPQPLARMGTLHQARNVHHIKECWDFAANQEEKNKDFRDSGSILRRLQHLYGYEDNTPKTFFFVWLVLPWTS